MGIRTPDLLNAIEALYQLSYDPLNKPLNRHQKTPSGNAIRTRDALLECGGSTPLSPPAPIHPSLGA